MHTLLLTIYIKYLCIFLNFSFRAFKDKNKAIYNKTDLHRSYLQDLRDRLLESNIQRDLRINHTSI